MPSSFFGYLFPGNATSTRLAFNGGLTATTIGVNNASPSFALDVAGFINTDQYSGYKQNGVNLIVGSTSQKSVFAGPYAGDMPSVYGGVSDTGLGYAALRYASSTNNNTAIGSDVLSGLGMSGSNNTGVGFNALQNVSSGGNNTAVGVSALQNVSGVNNDAFGLDALQSLTSGNNNNAFGAYALQGNTTGSGDVGIGHYALYRDGSATNTVAVGYYSGYGNSAYSNQGGTYLGYQTGYKLQSGSDYNTLLGYQAGYDIATGTNNLILGSEVPPAPALPPAPTISCSVKV